MKNILYIDLYSSLGHVKFNKNYIKGLLEAGFEVKFIFKEGYIKELSLPTSLLDLSLPANYFLDYKNSFKNRLQMLKMLWFIKRKIEFSKYDIIIFSGYEEISLFFSNIKNKIYLVNHRNISGLDNFVKRFFFKRISNKNTHIVFEDYIRKRLYQIGVKNVLVFPYGIPDPMVVDSTNNNFSQVFLPKKINFSNYKFVLFSPSASSVDQCFINELINNKRVISFLEKNKILLIFKGNLDSSLSDNIIIIKKYLTDNQYQNIFLQSDFILLSYPISYKYSVSAVFFECIANNKICLLSDIEVFKCYESFMNFYPFFKNTDDFLIKLNGLMNLEYNNLTNHYKNKDKLIPNFNQLLKIQHIK